MGRTLVLVDVQNDFCPGGALPTERGDDVAGRIGAYQLDHSEEYDYVVATKDWHIDPGDHFSIDPDYVHSWPVHCVAHTHGAELHEKVLREKIDEVFLKGKYSAAYSGFEGFSENGEVNLADWLSERGVTDLDIAGIATDYCVRATVLDALKEKFDVRVLTSKCASVNEQTGDAALAEMDEAGALLV